MPRRPLDFYETPPHYLRALFEVIKVSGNVLEPCAGDGCITQAIIDAYPDVFLMTNDIDESKDTAYHIDASKEEMYEAIGMKFDWIITNPPFSQEEEILRLALTRARSVAFLARLSFLEPTKSRLELYGTMGPPQQLIVLPRYSFRKNDDGKRQTDNVTCCWLVWSTESREIVIDGRRS